MPNTILVTGGAGYIGSHTVLVLLQRGFQVVVLDNLVNSSIESLKRVSSVTNREPLFFKGDVRDEAFLDSLFKKFDVDAVIHFAGLKAVSDSVSNPLDYYDVNVAGTVSLCRAMSLAGVYKLVFSSSATVYGDVAKVPINEAESSDRAINPYGRSKRMVEQILSDIACSDTCWSIATLRYFNPIGAHESGLIGENPNGIPNNLLPYIAKVAIGKLQKVQIFGDDYDTHDGTGVRDYIHVMDLADGHLNALARLNDVKGCHVWNLGTGSGYSVLDVLKAFENVCGRPIPYEIVGRRSGDVAISFADPSKARLELGWTAERDLTEMVRDTWRWQTLNPDGYQSS